MSANPIVDTLIELCGDDRPIVVHRPLVEFTGSLEAALLLNQLLYWTPKSIIAIEGFSGRWIARTDKEWCAELFLSRYSLRQARQTLESLRIIRTTTTTFKGAPTLHYQVVTNELKRAWVEFAEKRRKQEEEDAKAKCVPSPTPLFYLNNSDDLPALSENAQSTAAVSSTPDAPGQEIAPAPLSENAPSTPPTPEASSENAQSLVRIQTKHRANSDEALSENAQSITEITTEMTSEITPAPETPTATPPLAVNAPAARPLKYVSTQHPAVQIYKTTGITKPQPAVRDAIGESVTTDARSLRIWERVTQWWMISGGGGASGRKNPRNVQAMLDVYADVLTYPGDPDAAFEDWRTAREKYGWSQPYTPPEAYARTPAQLPTPAEPVLPAPQTPRARDLWQRALGELELQMTRATFEAWLRDTHGLHIEESGNTARFTVAVKNGYAIEWLESRLRVMIERTLTRLTDNENWQMHYVAVTEGAA